MGRTLNLGDRIELIAMDPHFHNISIALYRQEHDGKPQYMAHTYSGKQGADARLERLRHIMATLGGIEEAGGFLYFSCGAPHQSAIRRTFLEAAKVAPDAAVAPKALAVFDKRTNRNITAASLSGGRYQIAADGAEEGKATRVESITAGLAKLAEMLPAEGKTDEVQFACGHAHDAVVGLLLSRALNVRAILREEESAGARGLLVAPSQQK